MNKLSFAKQILKVLFLPLTICLFSIDLLAQDVIVPDTPPPPQTKKNWNEFDLHFTTARIGMAFIHEYAGYGQDATGKEQMALAGVDLRSQFKFRDFRFFASGRINTERTFIWRIAAMYDGAVGAWTFRETGLLIGLPKARGHVFIGRSKEGYSMYKVQNGYSTWGNERQMSLDLIPIMTDGVRYYGYSPSTRLFWSIGAFTNAIYGHNNKFALWEWQYSGRFGWRAIYKDDGKKLLHLGINFRYAKPDRGQIQVRSRPESNPAPYFIDTGIFKSNRSTAVGWEAYYQNGPLLLGSEGNSYSFTSAQAGNPRYFGYNLVASYIITGESHPYLSDNSVFHFVLPKKSVFEGGRGAWEVLANYSTFNLNSGLQPGGSFWKVTPQVNWYLHKYLRLEFVYGYGVLDRFHLQGTTQFFQTRLQVQIM